MTLALMLAAGALGTLARWALAVGAARVLPSPAGTLVANLLGAFALGLLVAVVPPTARGQELRVILGTGFLGAFTTFSTLELEAHGLLAGGRWPLGLAYLLGSTVLGLAAVALGRALGVSLTGRA